MPGMTKRRGLCVIFRFTPESSSSASVARTLLRSWMRRSPSHGLALGGRSHWQWGRKREPSRQCWIYESFPTALVNKQRRSQMTRRMSGADWPQNQVPSVVWPRMAANRDCSKDARHRRTCSGRSRCSRGSCGSGFLVHAQARTNFVLNASGVVEGGDCNSGTFREETSDD